MATQSQISNSQSRIIAFIQAGGRSARMGTDKAWLEIEGRPLIEHVLAAAQPVVAGLAIVINAANSHSNRYEKLAAQWGARLLHDLHDHCGPLGGIHTALTNCASHEAALILGCDLPFLTADLLTLLCQRQQAGRQSITVPLDSSGHPQPLVATYTQACLAPVTQMLAAGQLRLDRLYERVATAHIPFAELAALPNAAHFFLNINTPEEYQAALACREKRQQADFQRKGTKDQRVKENNP